MIFRVAAWIANDDYVVARLQSLASDPLTTQLASGAPFNGPALHDALVVGRLQLDEGVGVAIHELH